MITTNVCPIHALDQILGDLDTIAIYTCICFDRIILGRPHMVAMFGLDEHPWQVYIVIYKW